MAQQLSVSVQLYTVRDLTEKDFAGTMAEIKKIGFTGVELAGYGNLSSAKEVRKVLDDNGLVVSGAHVPIDQFEKDIAAVIADQQTLGNTHAIIPWLDEHRRKTAADWRAFAKAADAYGQKMNAAGIALSFHNHSFEFEKLPDDAAVGFDILWQTASEQNLKAELDVYWLEHGGRDPVKVIDSLGRRVWSLHLKDMTKDDSRKFAEVGTGRLNFPGILAAAKRNSIEWGVIEQDDCYGQPPLHCLKTSFDHLQQMLANV